MVLSDSNLIMLVQEVADRLDGLHSSVGNSPVEDDIITEDDALSALKWHGEDKAIGDAGFFNILRAIALNDSVLPKFVEQISGFSWPESFGRWTNTDIARITFRHSLPKIFTLDLIAQAAGCNTEQPILIVAGGTAQILRTRSGLPHRYQIVFDCKTRGNMIEFFIPHAISPNLLSCGAEQDKRRLGLGLHFLTIKATRAIPLHKRAMAFLRKDR